MAAFHLSFYRMKNAMKMIALDTETYLILRREKALTKLSFYWMELVKIKQTVITPVASGPLTQFTNCKLFN